MSIKKTLLPFFVFLAGYLPLNCQVQDYYMKTYTVENGLVYNNVKDIARDKSGFLWIATFDGLSRYDGYEFRNYYHDPDDSTSLGDINLLNVCIDKDNNVWVVGARDMCRYNRHTDKFIRYSMSSVHQLNFPSVNSITTDASGNFWISHKSRLCIYDGTSETFREVPVHFATSGPPRDGFVHIEFDQDNGFWAYEGNFMLKGILVKGKDSAEDHMEITGHFDFASPMPDFFYLSTQLRIITSKQQNTWFFSNKGLFVLKRGEKMIRPAREIPAGEVFPGIELLAWGTMSSGMTVCYPGSGKQVILTDNKLNYIQSWFIDDRIIWTGGLYNTAEGVGLNKIIFPESHFHHYFFKTDENKPLAVFAVTRDKYKNIWVGGKGARYIFRVDTAGHFVKCNAVPEEQLALGEHVRSFLETKDRMIVGFFRKMAYSFDPGSDPLKLGKVPGSQSRIFVDLPGIDSYKLLRWDRNGHDLLVGGLGEFFRIDPDSGKVRFAFSGKDISDIYSIYQDENNDYWVGGIGTLFFIGKDFKTRKEIPVMDKKYNIECIIGGDENCLWLALLGGGICRFNKTSYHAESFTTRDGLANNFAYNILKDKYGCLWISTNKGISRFDPRASAFRNFSLSDGLKIEEFNADAAFECPDGMMIFGGMGGIVCFYPDSLLLRRDPYNTPLVITEFKVAGIPTAFEGEGSHPGRVTLQKGASNVEVSFACIDFIDAEKIRYRYCLSPQDHGWITTDSKHRSVNYAGLTPGSYDFLLEATDTYGNWTKKISLKIHIPPFFYQTVLFKVILVMVALFLAFIFYRMLLHQVRLKEHKKHEELKLESLRGQMNPHFIFNSLNSINYFISLSDKVGANRYITDFSRLIRSILTNSANEYIPMDKEIESLEDYFRLEHLRFGDKFDYEIIIDPAINPVDLEIAPTMVQPFAENAIWHGVRSLESRKGRIRIRYSMIQPDFITCVIEDDGVGRKISADRKTDEQKRRRSRGIAIIHERLKLINSMRKLNLKIIVDDLFPGNPETGTRVIIEIPVKPERETR